MPLTGLTAKEDNIYRVIIYVGLATIGFVSAAKFSKNIEVFVTSFIGAYSFIRGISIYAGGFPNELDINPESI